MGVVPWFAGTDLHFAFASLMTISVLGLVSANPTLHGVLASVNLIMILAGMAAGSR
jgi:hypothetical protein